MYVHAYISVEGCKAKLSVRETPQLVSAFVSKLRWGVGGVLLSRSPGSGTVSKLGRLL